MAWEGTREDWVRVSDDLGRIAAKAEVQGHGRVAAASRYLGSLVLWDVAKLGDEAPERMWPEPNSRKLAEDLVKSLKPDHPTSLMARMIRSHLDGFEQGYRELSAQLVAELTKPVPPLPLYVDMEKTDAAELEARWLKARDALRDLVVLAGATCRKDIFDATWKVLALVDNLPDPSVPRLDEDESAGVGHEAKDLVAGDAP